MRLSEQVNELQITLDSKTNRKWPAADLVMALNSQQRSCIRKMVQTDQAYFNHTFTLSKTLARTVHSGIFSWRLPLWVMSVSAVRQSNGGSTTTRGDMLPRATKYDSSGWKFTASNELVVIGFASAIDLELEVAKIPARMTQGTLPSQAGMGTTQMKLEADAGATYPHDFVVDAYAGGLFEITGPVSARVGQLLRCISSTGDPAGRVLTFEEAWASQPLTSDTYEMHMELPMQHSRLLILLAARALLSQEKNVEGVALLREELGEQWSQFISAIQNRDLTQPHTVIECLPNLPYTRETTYQDEYL